VTRQKYAQKGARFRVVKAGARLSWMVPVAAFAHSGGGRPLEVGEVIESRGFIMGWGSDNIPECNFTVVEGEPLPENAVHVVFKPDHAFWSPWPAEGWLEPVGPTEEGETTA
jgi:hypothetical protein